MILMRVRREASARLVITVSKVQINRPLARPEHILLLLVKWLSQLVLTVLQERSAREDSRDQPVIVRQVITVL